MQNKLKLEKVLSSHEFFLGVSISFHDYTGLLEGVIPDGRLNHFCKSCHAGFTEMVVPLMAGNRLAGAMFAGPFLFSAKKLPLTTVYDQQKSRNMKHTPPPHLEKAAVENLYTTIMIVAVSIISEKCGFGDVSAFHRIFSSQMGNSPLQYRKSIKPKDGRDV